MAVAWGAGVKCKECVVECVVGIGDWDWDWDGSVSSHALGIWDWAHGWSLLIVLVLLAGVMAKKIGADIKF